MLFPRRVRTRAVPVVLLATSLAAAGCSGGGGRSASALPAAPVKGSVAATPPLLGSKIQHVIVVILENRSFDNIFSDDAALANTRNGPVNVDSMKMAPVKGGGMVAVQPNSLSLSSADAGHSHQDFMRQFDGGRNDGFAPATEIGYVPHGEVQPYYDMASQFAISDDFFHGVTAPTWPSHLEIGAATTYGIIDNPSSNAWGCDAKPGTTTGLFDPSAADEEDHGGGPYPCFDSISLFDLMDRAGVSWHYYAGVQGSDITGNLNIAADFRHIRFGPDWNTDIGSAGVQVLPALAGNTLPQVSFVIPDDTSTDHAGTPSEGPTYVETLVNAFGNSSYINNTLMLITWDDWGGWYDHVPPPKRPDGSQLSFRKPILIVGGLVKHNYVTHVQTEDASIDKTIEEIFNLGTLGAHDVLANGFDDAIDIAQTPPAFVPITSPQGMAITQGPIPPTTLGGALRTKPRLATGFRVVPADYGTYLGHGAYASGQDDYYGRRSADY